MKTFDKPAPIHADVHDTLSAAARVAESLRLRAQQVVESRVEVMQEQVRTKGRGIMERLKKAFETFVE